MQFQPYGFLGGFAPVSLNGKFGFINSKGKPITECIYSFVSYFQHGLATIYLSDKAGIIDKNGKYFLKPENVDVGIITESLISVSKNGKYGYINHTGSIVIPYQYDSAESFITGRGKIGIKGPNGKNKYGFIDTEGKQVVKPIYDMAYTFDSKGYAIIEIGNKSGVIDKDGNFIIPLTQNIKFEVLEGYKYGDTKKLYYKDYINESILVFKNSLTNKYGYMKIDGKIITEPIYRYAEQFENGIARVFMSDITDGIDKIGYIDINGNISGNLQDESWVDEGRASLNRIDHPSPKHMYSKHSVQILGHGPRLLDTKNTTKPIVLMIL